LPQALATGFDAISKGESGRLIAAGRQQVSVPFLQEETGLCGCRLRNNRF